MRGHIFIKLGPKVLLEKLGIWREHNAKRITDALLNMPYMEEEIKNED